MIGNLYFFRLFGLRYLIIILKTRKNWTTRLLCRILGLCLLLSVRCTRLARVSILSMANFLKGLRLCDRFANGWAQAANTCSLSDVNQ